MIERLFDFSGQSYSCIAFGVEYCGAKYSGWQRQKTEITVQESVEQALSKVANEPIAIIAAGRTDAGVHALGQVCHFFTSANRKLDNWLLGANRYLPNDIALKWCRLMPLDFHARFKAIERQYCYALYNGAVYPALFRQHVGWHAMPLNHENMQQTLSFLVGKHDFSSFRAAGCQSKMPVRTIKHLDLRVKGNWFLLDIVADGFLHHMVRNIMGVLLAVGDGRRPPSWVKEVIMAKDRRFAATTAPPQGLYFINAKYHAKYNLPSVKPNLFFV